MYHCNQRRYEGSKYYVITHRLRFASNFHRFTPSCKDNNIIQCQSLSRVFLLLLFSVSVRGAKRRVGWNPENFHRLNELQNHFIIEGGDLMQVLFLLKSNGLVPENLGKWLLRKFSTQAYQNRKEERKEFVCSITSQVSSLLDLLDIFRQITPITRLANPRADDNPRHRGQLFTFFLQKKSILDNGGVENRLEMCQRDGNKLLLALNRPENARRQQILWDFYVLTRFLYIQQLRDGGFESRKEVIDEMMNNLPVEVDSGFAHLMYQVKMATSKVNAGDFDSAEQLFDDVLRNVQFCNNRFMKALVFHDGSYIYRNIYFHTGNEMYIERVDEMTRNAVLAQDEGLSPGSGFWSRLLLLQILKIYLDIDSSAKVNNERPLKPEHKMRAQEIVPQLCENFDSMESRREMSLRLCQARLKEDDNELEDAIYYTAKAKSLTCYGAYYSTDRENIELYYTKLVLKLLPPAL